MPSFGERSKANLETCDPALRSVLEDLIKYIDFAVICGYRTQEEQDVAYDEGKSELKYPQSKHNSYPSRAVDIAPYPIDWFNAARFAHLAGLAIGLAKERGINLRWGGDWNQNGELTDNKFNDLPHLELV